MTSLILALGWASAVHDIIITVMRHLKFETATVRTMDDVSRSDYCAANERKTKRMNMSDGSKMKIKDGMSSSTSSSTESPPTSSLTTARYCLDQTFGCRSATRHKVEMYFHSLNRLQVQEERLEPLAAATGGEIEIVRQIADFEEQILRLEAPSSPSILSSSRSLSFASRRNPRLQMILNRIHVAAKASDIPAIVQEMMDPIQGGLSAVVQERCIQSLLALTLSCQENKLHVMNCSGISAVVAAMRNHTHDAIVQRQGAALLLNLPFFSNKKDSDSDEDTSVFNSHNNRTITRLRDDSPTRRGKKSTSTRTTTTTTTTTSLLDLHVVQLLVQEGALHCVLVATEENLLQVVMDLAGDESDNYARVFAKAQIPALCQLLMDLYGFRYPTSGNHGDTNGVVTTTTTAARSLPRLGPRERHEQNQKVGQELSFIRRSLASLVDDPSIAPDTLVSFLQCKH